MKKYILSMIAIACLLIAGCEGGEQTKTGESPFIGGTNGIVAEFEPLGIEENGVYTIYDEDTFPMQIVLKNKGEQEVAVNKANVKVEGIYLGDFSGISGQEKKNSEILEGISEINKNGGESIVDFGANAKYIQAIHGDFVPLEILAKYTYEYKTKAVVPKACFVEDLQDTKFCKVDEAKTVFSSAAPIQVAAVTEAPGGAGKVALTFEVSNVGGGSSTIPGKAFNTKYDEIRYKIVPDSEAAKWKCTSIGRENEARFADQKTTIVCKLNTALKPGDRYTKEIAIELEYDYMNIIQESLRVKKSS